MATIKFLLFLLFSALLITPSAAGKAPELSEKLIAQHTVYFDVQDTTFIGADTLTTALATAHFVALGELHNRTRLGELTETLLHTLKPHGFSHFAIETGPYSARKLQHLVRAGEADVSAFYATYSSRIYDIVPIPFFSGKTDLRFLATANALDYELWGLDQEYYFSYAYLIDELASLAGESLSREQQRLHRKVKRSMFWLDRRNQFRELFGSNFQRSCRLQYHANFRTYLNSFAQFDNADIQQILRALEKTIDIYCMAERGEASEPMRVNYFKENFDRNFAAAQTANPEAKVFLKMGSFHLGRHRSPLNLEDIGNHVAQLAESRNESSVHIYYLNRFFAGRDNKSRSGWESSERFMSVGDKAQWALIDLRPLRQLATSEHLTGNSFEIATINNYDFIIIAPEDQWVSRHW